MPEPGRPPVVDPLARVTSLRSALRRSRLPRLVLVVVAGWAIGSGLASTHAEARQARAAWGSEVTVWVVRRDLPAGVVIGPGDIEPRRLPVAVVPPGVAERDPTGRRIRDPLVEGEPVHAARLAGARVGAVAARLPDGTAAITLAHDGALLAIDDRVDLHSLVSGSRLARAAEVLAVDETRFTAAVRRDEIAAVVRALTTGGVVPVVTG